MSWFVEPGALLAGALVAARAGSFLLGIPALGMRTLPMVARLGIAIWMAAAAWPVASAHARPVALEPLPVAMAISGELLAGLLLAFAVSLFFAGAQMAGQLVGIQIGFAIANVVDPTSDMQVSILGQLYYLFALLVFLAIDGPMLVCGGLIGSFQALPAGGFAIDPEGLFGYLRGASMIFVVALQVAAPVVVALLLVSLSLGIIGRSVPQLNVLVVGFPLKIGVGLLVLMASVPHVVSWMESRLLDLPAKLLGAAGALATGG